MTTSTGCPLAARSRLGARRPAGAARPDPRAHRSGSRRPERRDADAGQAGSGGARRPDRAGRERASRDLRRARRAARRRPIAAAVATLAAGRQVRWAASGARQSGRRPRPSVIAAAGSAAVGPAPGARQAAGGPVDVPVARRPSRCPAGVSARPAWTRRHQSRLRRPASCRTRRLAAAGPAAGCCRTGRLAAAVSGSTVGPAAGRLSEARVGGSRRMRRGQLAQVGGCQLQAAAPASERASAGRRARAPRRRRCHGPRAAPGLPRADAAAAPGSAAGRLPERRRAGARRRRPARPWQSQPPGRDGRLQDRTRRRRRRMAAGGADAAAWPGAPGLRDEAERPGVEFSGPGTWPPLAAGTASTAVRPEARAARHRAAHCRRARPAGSHRRGAARASVAPCIRRSGSSEFSSL